MHEGKPYAGEVKPASPSGVYSWYVVIVLMLCQLLASVDARLPYIMIEALKQDLGLSDTQIGLITGPAFSLTYALCAIPIAKLSDRRNRVVIIGGAIVIWSGFTAATGLARGLSGFALTRIGVAIGESALTPAAHSIIASYLPKREHARGMAIYSFGAAAGAFVALAAGGYIGDRFGWETAFLTIGGAGLILAILVATTMREPLRHPDSRVTSDTRGSVFALLENPVIRNVVIGGGLLGFSSGAINGWGLAYVMRTFGLSATETGTTYGAVVGLVAMVGILAGGIISGWLSDRHPRYTLQMLSGALLLAMMAQIGAFLMDSYSLFLIFLAITVLLSCFYIGPTYAAIQSQANPAERSFASAVALFCINGIGIAAGTFVVGLLSDMLSDELATDSLKWSLLAVSFIKVWSALHYWFASRWVGTFEKGLINSSTAG